MGCSTSRIDDSEVVMRCKNRRRLMKDAVNYRQDFAISHLAYIQALRNVGFALRHFAEGDYSDAQTSPGSPTTPVLSLPQTSSPPVAALSPPPQAPPALSPPPSPPPNASPPPTPAPPPKAASPPSSPPHPSTPPPESSPPASPLAEASPPTPPPDASPPYEEMSRSINMPSPYSGNGMVSPERSSNFSPPYSPVREESDDFWRAFPPAPPHISLNPPPPPSPPRSSAWDFLDLFHPPPIPYHLQEQRRMKQVEEVEEEEEVQDFEQVREEEGLPDLEEEDQKEEEKEQLEQKEEGQKEVPVEEKAAETVTEETEEKVPEKVSEISTENVEEKVEEKQQEKEAVVTAVAKEVTVESVKKEKEKKELAVLTTAKGKNLTEVVRHIDDQFARAYDSGKDVSGMLETQRVHNHLSLLDLKDSSKVFNAITWHWSNKTTLAMKDADEDSDVAECGMTGSHASTLERLYAWEKKLYDEVKAGEHIRMDFDRKCKQLRSLDAKGEDPIVIDKTRAAIKKLDTRLMVALRAVHSASMRIQQLTTEELYPQLAELLGGLMNMWKVMLECHKTQKEIALEMQTLEKSIAGDEASEAHKRATVELERELETWQNNFMHWMGSQRKYIDALFQWLRLCHMEPETDMKGRAVSPYWVTEDGGPPIYPLIKKWHLSLVRLEEQMEIVDAINNFATVVHSLQLDQSEELHQKKRAEILAKDLDRKTLSLQNMEKRYVEEDSDDKPEPVTVRSTVRNTLQERRAALNSFRSMVEEEKYRHSKTVQDRRETTLSSLKANLPNIFESMTSFAGAALQEYEALQKEAEISKLQSTENGKMHQISEE